MIKQHLLVAAILGLGAPATYDADIWIVSGRVVENGNRVTVRDTDDAKTRHKIRLGGIDAPENRQAFGERSKQNLSLLAFDRTIDAHCHKRDRYGREVCKVMSGSIDVNLEQLRAGMAWWYREYAKEQSTEDWASYAQAEDDAGDEARAMEGREAGAAVGVAQGR